MSKRRTIKNEIEYEEAPCGYVSFYNYKEPLMKFTEGYGFVGALVFDGKTDKIQCHLCGEWLGSLPHHLKREHNMTSSAYKTKVGLLQTTALISESARAKLIASGMKSRLKNLVNRTGMHTRPETKERIRRTLIENTDKSEARNLRNTCPDQLKERMQKIFNEKGKYLRMEEFDNFKGSIIRCFGSIKQACEYSGIPWRKPGMTLKTHLIQLELTDENAIKFIKEFKITFNEFPRKNDFIKQKKNTLLQFILKGKGIKYYATRAIAEIGIYQKDKEHRAYTKTELLNFIRRFKEINSREPSYSDCKRGLLPGLSTYTERFGSWKIALTEAFQN